MGTSKILFFAFSSIFLPTFGNFFNNRKCACEEINQNIFCQFKQAKKQWEQGIQKKEREKKWPQGKALHNELEIATVSNTVTAFPARAVTPLANFSLNKIVELVCKITKDHCLYC